MAARTSDDSTPCNLTLGSVRKLKRVVDRFDGKGPPGGGSLGRAGGGWTPGVVRAQVTTAIPTGSFASPSSTGRAKIAYLVAGTWALESSPVEVYNDNTLAASIPVNRVCKLVWICGQWWLLSASCS